MSGSQLEVIAASDSNKWADVLAQSQAYDFYHLAGFHHLSERYDGGRGHLFVYRSGPYQIALPLLLRGVNEVQGLEGIEDAWLDASSPSGYSGPIVSHLEIPSEVVLGFQKSLLHQLREMKVVSVFSRLHPLLTQANVLEGLGECTALGKTVAIDTSRPFDTRSYRKSHRRSIRKLRKAGVIPIHDTERRFVAEFSEIYLETMQRVRAADRYYYDEEYFRRFLLELGESAHLFFCKFERELICGGLYVVCNGIVQAHLGGVRTSALSLAPSKLETCAVHEWACGIGAKWLHLGGGVGAEEDSLFHFKAGFSELRHDFRVWKWKVIPDQFDRLDQMRQAWILRQGLTRRDDSFFPGYRAPAGELGKQASSFSGECYSPASDRSAKASLTTTKLAT